ncbi:capsular polysaccharide transport system ATP-binding protein [Gemmobacter megaterium]|uniref:Capsular polysaccharide transport system ATP-binding protein n=1 Tax=Gemmobacter megaterium TaxID=1086013 RepID=A0A1N7QH06_9RHOB|nr:ABC transporter ATP-binding protein [Gemmobacter megaterium]GGE26269.1 ATP-binding protein [Gemmobacter megaterium]SIT22150.1 capsular polysaccharide transport system ATP-binding protein [Gemmobacter megaterium]
MVRLENLSKSYVTEGQRKVVADNISVTFPSGASVALLGRNGAGKSTLLQIIAGTTNPSSGRVVSTGSISWPVGYAGSFHGDLTGAQNVRFIARVYGVDTGALVEFVEGFAELGPQFHMPFRTYSSGMRSRLAFGLSMGIHFDTYLVDEVTAVGDARFKRKSEAFFMDRMSRSGAIFVAHSMGAVRRLCTHGAVLEGGRLTWHDDVNDAIAHHEFNMSRP